MNAPFRIAAADLSAHVFRSMFIDSFSRLEDRTIAIWNEIAAPPSFEGKALPHFGNRVKRIRELADTRPARFSSAEAVASLLDQLKPYCKLRATLVHGRLVAAGQADGVVQYTFDNPLDGPNRAFANRATLKDFELDTIIEELNALVDELCKLDVRRAP